jgi:hypothetical protein
MPASDTRKPLKIKSVSISRGAKPTRCPHRADPARDRAALVGAAVVATLAATHRSAVRENARAYFNGVRDGSEGRWGDVFVGNGEE